MNDVSVFGCVGTTFKEIFRNWRTLLVALFIPALAISAVELSSLQYPDSFPYNLIFWALGAPFYVLFAVVCHRTVILGADSLPNVFGLFWTERETGFLGWTVALIIVNWCIGLGFVFVALLMPGGILSGIAPLALLAVIFYLYARLCMLFPATAVGDRTSFEIAWSLTYGNGLNVMGILIFTVGPLLALMLGLAWLLEDAPAFTQHLAYQTMGHILWATAVCAVSVTYRALSAYEETVLP